MKKRMLLLALALLLLFSACAAPVGSTTGTTGSQVPATGYTAGNLDKVKLTVMGDSNPMPGFDAENKYTYMPTTSFMETDTFYMGTTDYGNILYYYDKVTGNSDVVCADPACTHDSDSCGAYISIVPSVFYYNGQRWWIDKEDLTYTLCRSDLSGINQENIKNISWEDIILTYGPQQYAIHRGNLFILGTSSQVTGAARVNRYTLLASPLDGTEEYVTIFDTSSDSYFLHSVRFVGTKVYYSMITMPEESARALEIVTYDLATGTYETVYKESGISTGISEPWVTAQGEIYLAGSDGTAGYVWKLENGQRTLVTTFAGAGTPCILDGAIICVTRTDGIRSIEVRDFSGATLYNGLMFPEGLPEIPKGPDKAGLAFVGGDEEKLILNLMVYTDANEEEGYIVLLDIQNGMKATLLWSSEQ